ncbi:hypothetical protein RN001_010294 [Aquatica leii]|uniref:RING-type domain-containing protein n=1 Tax=Aquatica leii TaxID=1421715 RepID=A0AAN7QHD1_9COLE|nr:hypothetical protein RN001_010294 [Aquatica leii]
MELQILFKYPLLLPKNHNLNEFEGYINVQGGDYKIHVQRVNGQITLLHSDFDAPHWGNKYSDMVQYLDALYNDIAAKTTPTKSKNDSEHYRHVLSEYLEFREFYINVKECRLSPDLTAITMKIADEGGRVQSLKISVNTNFNIIEHSLPDKKELLTSYTSLTALYEKFLQAIEELQPYFYIMESLDTAWVLDPEVPTPKDNYRRIAIDHNVSLIVTVNPWMCNDIPQLQFMGPERLVDDYHFRISSNLSNWDLQGNIIDELVKLLEMETFPVKQVEADETALYNTGDCCICFSLRLNGNLPEINCKNPSCEQFFHTDCLYQWLVSVGTKTKRCFNEVNGECPNCEKHISCPIP